MAANHDAIINQAVTSADVVAAPAYAKQYIRVHGWNVSSVTAGTTFKFQSYNATTQTDKTGAMPLASGVANVMQAPDSEGFLFECNSGDSLRMVLSGNTATGILLYSIRGPLNN